MHVEKGKERLSKLKKVFYIIKIMHFQNELASEKFEADDFYPISLMDDYQN